MSYKHTQIGYLMIYIFVALVAYFIFMFYITEYDFWVALIMIIVLLILISFSYLTVNIDDTFLRLKFGYGIYSKKFMISEIKSIEVVKNRWYYGWGIRVLIKPFRRLYNVSGYDAIEFTMDNGDIFRIGTDEPNDLKEALEQAIKKH